MTNKLKQCPFCRSDAVHYPEPPKHAVTCTNPQCGAAVSGFATKAEAIAAWNTRQHESAGVDGWVIPLKSMTALAQETFANMMVVVCHGGAVDVCARVDGKEYRWECDGLKYAKLLRTPEQPASGWQPIETAPRDGTRVLVKFKDDLSQYEGMGPGSLERWQGVPFVARNRGDVMEWVFAAPVGHGGLPDAWLDGWMPLPAALQPTAKEAVNA